MGSMWIAPERLLLASTSALRAQILIRAGLPAQPVSPTVDERAVQARLQANGEPASAVARHLAAEKALSVSARSGAAYVIGFDQTLEFEGSCLSKPSSRDDLAARLTAFSGAKHHLHSGFAIAQNARALSAGVSSATVLFRAFPESYSKLYLDASGPEVLDSVGGYQIEGLGIHLFEEIEGDFFTVIGTPLLQLLASLRALRLIAQ